MGKTYIGIDHGNEGAASVLFPDGSFAVMKLPTYILAGRKTVDSNKLNQYLEYWVYDIRVTGDVVFVIEEASKHIQSQLAASSVWFGYRGVIEAVSRLGKRFAFISAKKWQKEFGINGKGTGTKAKSIAMAKQLFPGINLKKSERARKDDDNIADSILLAEYGRRMNL